MPTCEEITAALAAQRERIETWFGALSDEQMRRPMTNSEIESGAMWSAKDHLAHVLGTERFFQGAIKRALAGAEDPLGFYTHLGTDDRTALRAMLNQANEQAVQKYRLESSEAILGRLDETRQVTLALLDTFDDARLAQPIPHSPFGDGTYGALFMTIALHGKMHIKWLDEASAGAAGTGAHGE